jgi:hypothetical protein
MTDRPRRDDFALPRIQYAGEIRHRKSRSNPLAQQAAKRRVAQVICGVREFSVAAAQWQA